MLEPEEHNRKLLVKQKWFTCQCDQFCVDMACLHSHPSFHESPLAVSWFINHQKSTPSVNENCPFCAAFLPLWPLLYPLPLVHQWQDSSNYRKRKPNTFSGINETAKKIIGCVACNKNIHIFFFWLKGDTWSQRDFMVLQHQCEHHITGSLHVAFSFLIFCP